MGPVPGSILLRSVLYAYTALTQLNAYVPVGPVPVSGLLGVYAYTARNVEVPENCSFQRHYHAFSDCPEPAQLLSLDYEMTYIWVPNRGTIIHLSVGLFITH